MAIQHRFLPGRPRSVGRLAFILLLAGAGAYIVGLTAPELLIWLHRVFSPRDPGGTLRTPTAAETEVFRQLQSRLPMALLGAILGGFVGNFLLRQFDNAVERWENMDTGDKVTLFLGIFAGIIASIPFLFLLQNLRVDSSWIFLGLFGLIVGFAAMSVYALQSMATILPWKAGATGRRSGIKILDTNVIIDGRIYDVIRAGFLEGQLYVPGFVLEELQYIADSHDPLRRQRGRRGLDVLRHMEADFDLQVRTHDRLAPDLNDGVDARLIRLARALGADIVTNDFNLNRVAGLQDIRVLSLNDLALALRSNVMPQEHLTLTVSREGNQTGQGVGYLEDGTMVVVENGKTHIGETLDVLVTQVIQTERGKMIFAEIEGEHGHEGGGRRARRPRA